MDKIKDASKKTSAEAELDWEQREFSAGTYLDPPASEIPDNAIVKADDCKVFAKWIEGRTGTKQWGDAELPTVPGRNNYVASKSGDIITKTVGQNFVDADEDYYFIWPDGVHEQISEVISATQVRVRSSEAHSATTALNPGKIRGPINGIHFHSGKRYVVIEIDTRFFYSDIYLNLWTEIYNKSIADPLCDITVFSEYGDFVFGFNANGIFKLDLGLSIPECYQCNSSIPENTIVEVTESVTVPYGRRYLYSMSRILGNGIINRESSGAIIKLESGTPAPDPDYDSKDFREVFNAFPYGSGPGVYQVLTCAATTRTFVEWTSNPGFNKQFNITLNGLSADVVLYSAVLSTFTTWEQIASYAQTQIRSRFAAVAPNATCVWDSDHFEFSAGQGNGDTVGYIAAPAGGINIGENTYFNGCTPPGGNGTIADQYLYVTIGPLTNPGGERHWTHYSIYGTKDTGVNGSLNDPNAYVWLEDVPIIKSFTASRNIGGDIIATDGTFSIYDVGTTIRFANGITDTIVEFVSDTQVTGTAGLVIASQGATIGATKCANASQAGYLVTSTAGSAFSSSDVGKTLRWADGYSVYVTEFVDANNVMVAEDQVHPAQGLAWDSTTRTFNDTTTDEIIENRYRAYQLQQRFWKELPVINAGIVVPGFMFCAVRGENLIYYSQLGFGLEYLAGYHNVAYQYETLNDAVSHFVHFPDMAIIYCSRSTKRIPINTSKSVTVPGTKAVVTIISGVTTVDSEIGCLDFGSIRDIEEGKQILVTSEPGVRMFDGYRYGPNLTIDQNGLGHMVGELRKLQAALASSYDPIDGYVLWGSDQPL